MMPRVVLCADAESMRRPELIGLAGENLVSQEWLALFSSAEEARRFLRNDHTISEVWVAGSDEIDSINLAATLKRDRSDTQVCLLAFEETGSLRSRAGSAGIDTALSLRAFAERYAQTKRAHLGSPSAPRVMPYDEARAVARAGVEQPASQAHALGGAVSATTTYPHVCAAQAPAYVPGAPSAAAVHAPSAVQQAEQALRARQMNSAASQPAGKSAFFLPVVSGSGGTGKSTVAALSALFAQGLGYKTLLLDFDLRFGDMHDVLGLPDALCIDEALAAPERLARLEPEGLVPALLAAPKRLEGAEAIMHAIPGLLNTIQGHFEVVVANTGAAWAEEHALLLERSSKALFLVDQRTSSLRSCKHALDLCARCGIATGPFLFAVNRCGKGAQYTSIDISCALQGSSVVELRDGGQDVEALLSAGQPLDLIADKNDLCTSLENILVDILPGCAGRTLRLVEPRSKRPERRFGRGRRRGRGEE